MKTVLLLHGLFRSPLSMWPMARAFKAKGYKVHNWGYSSFASLAEIAAKLEERLPELEQSEKVHGIGHSMGGLLLRYLFSRTQMPLGRLVLMGTPNIGARIVAHHDWLFRHEPLPQCIRDMSPESDVMKSWPIPACEIGVIAGVEKFNPINPASWLNRRTLGDVPHDGTVELSSAKLPEMADFLEIKANHSFLPTNRKVIRACLRFTDGGALQEPA
jgi:triacylglycerol lipase